MKTQLVEVRKNITISRSVADNKFSSVIDIDFIPDEVVIKSVRFLNTGAAVNRITSIYSDMVSDLIGSCSDNSVIWNDVKFPLGKQIKGLYRFYFQLPSTSDATNIGTLQNKTGDVTIQLEFVKYKI